MNVGKHMLPEQQKQVQLYCQIIFNSVVKMPPLNGFASEISYRDNHLESSDDICTHLLTSYVHDSFPQLQKLAGILLCCPVGTANVEHSFSTMNRGCNKLRQRLTPAHLSHLLQISQEGPEKLERNELKDIVYIWHQQKHRHLMIPTD